MASTLLLMSFSVCAQRTSELSDDLPNGATMAIQEKVEKLFDAGAYERAFFIYRNELSPLGDKYAQYMVGFMYSTGLGVEQDSVTAVAWYRLAAERGTREFVAVRDRALRVMDDESIDASNALYYELRLKYCDLAVLLSSIKRDVNNLQTRTGSRTRGQTSPVAVIGGRSSRYSSGADYYTRVREDLEARMRLLKEVEGFEDVIADADRVNVHELERRIVRHIESEAE